VKENVLSGVIYKNHNPLLPSQSHTNIVSHFLFVLVFLID